MSLGTHAGYYHNDQATICDICGFRYKRSETCYNYKHRRVCYRCDDGPRNPQDYAVHPKGDAQAVADPRPRGAEVFIDPALPPDPDSFPPTCGFGPGAIQSS
jgi:hypothetical protein